MYVCMYVCMSVTHWNVIYTIPIHISFKSVVFLTISLLCAWIWYELVCQRWQVVLLLKGAAGQLYQSTSKETLHGNDKVKWMKRVEECSRKRSSCLCEDVIMSNLLCMCHECATCTLFPSEMGDNLVHGYDNLHSTDRCLYIVWRLYTVAFVYTSQQHLTDTMYGA